ncbi:hypothetical protein ACS0TY_012505 [Phlomoides rotata]
MMMIDEVYIFRFSTKIDPMNMQTEAAGSISAVADCNTLNSALFSLDSFDRQIENHGFPSALGEAMISFSRGQSSNSRVADELWNIHSGKNTVVDFSIASSYHQIHDMENVSYPIGRYATFENRPAPFSYPFESPKTVITSSKSSAFESTDYSLDGCLPFTEGVVGTTQVGNHRLNEWISRGEEGPSRFNKELSLSLATSQPCSGMTSSHKTLVGSDNTSCSSNSLSLNFNSYKPTPQLSPMLSGSRFLHAMQEILAEVSYYALQHFDQRSYGIDHDSSFSSTHLMFQNKQDVESKKKHLLSLLQMVDDQYNQCLDEIHTVVSAFHAVTELDPNLHARFALPTVSLMYRKLRERISSYILAMGDKYSDGEDRSYDTSFIQKQWALQQLSKSDHQLWRPQRGLPERSVSVLKAWMYQNFLHPYPKDAEKHLLAMKSGLTRSQVSNWFINARVRLWKPMIEEMCAEMHRRKARRVEEETDSALRNQNMRFTLG